MEYTISVVEEVNCSAESGLKPINRASIVVTHVRDDEYQVAVDVADLPS